MKFTPSNPGRQQLRFAAVRIVAPCAAVFAICATSALAAPPSVTVSQPVEVIVKEPVKVYGTVEVASDIPVSVEVVNDSLKEPHFARLDPIVGAGTAQFRSDPVTIPEGKRFVIESISVDSLVPVGQSVRLALYFDKAPDAPSATPSGRVPLAMQPQGNQSGGVGQPMFTVWAGNHPLKLVFDPTKHVLTALCSRGGTEGIGLYFIEFAGYLEDL